MHRPTAQTYLNRTESSSDHAQFRVVCFPEEIAQAQRACAFLSLLVNQEEASWLIRPLAFRGFQIKRTRRGWTSYVKAAGKGGEYVVFSTYGAGPLEVLSESYNAFTNKRVWRADTFPLKY